MRKKIKRIVRRKRLTSLALKIMPLVLIIVGGVGGYLYCQNDYLATVEAFDQALMDGRGKDARVAAMKLNNRNEYLKKVFKDHLPAMTFIKDSGKAKKVIALAATARKRAKTDAPKEVKLLIEQTDDEMSQAERNFDACKFDRAIMHARKARKGYDKAFIRVSIVKARKKCQKGKWQDAFDILNETTKIMENDEVKKIMSIARSKLVPELLIETYVNGRRAKGAYVFINGKQESRGQLTPARVMLDMNVKHNIGVVLPPNEGRYYLPAKKTVIFHSKEAQRLRFDLKLIPGPKKGVDWEVPKIKLSMKFIDSGSFVMGSDSGEIFERPRHRVALSKFCWIGKYEVTRMQFLKMLKKSPKELDATMPIGGVTRADANLFCKKLNMMETRKNRIPRGYEYRLPTEAEWEYCCRAGRKQEVDVNDYGWHAGNSNGHAKEIGTKKANDFGIYDMLGNMAEWCEDSFDGAVYSNCRNGVTNPIHLSKGNFFSVRGGGFKSPAAVCKSYSRGKMARSATAPYVGFRVILAPRKDSLIRK